MMRDLRQRVNWRCTHYKLRMLNQIGTTLPTYAQSQSVPKADPQMLVLNMPTPLDPSYYQ